MSLQSRERVRLLEVRVRGLELQIRKLSRVVLELANKLREASI